MKTKLLMIALVAALGGVALAQQKAAPVPAPRKAAPATPGAAPAAPGAAPAAAPAAADEKGKTSYSIGYQIGTSMRTQEVPIDVKAFLAGMQDAMGNAKPAIPEEEMREAMIALTKRAETRMLDKFKKEGDAFLAANAKKEGVKTTKTGLQYKVLKEGTGKSPKATDRVKAHYVGTLIDGTKFDSSYDRGEPSPFPVNRVIAGWTEALQMMKVGSKWQLFIPSDLAYGVPGNEVIPPNSALVFEVELVEIEQ